MRASYRARSAACACTLAFSASSCALAAAPMTRVSTCMSDAASITSTGRASLATCACARYARSAWNPFTTCKRTACFASARGGEAAESRDAGKTGRANDNLILHAGHDGLGGSPFCSTTHAASVLALTCCVSVASGWADWVLWTAWWASRVAIDARSANAAASTNP
eukprot:6176702-Pleurochrysis_carterae.AAC.1